MNPGRTDGLRGRKRDVTEGGIRVIGLVEYPHLVKQNRVEERFPIVTMDTHATVLDMLGMHSFEDRPLDGESLLPYLRGERKSRLGAIGWHGVFYLGSTNHVNGTFPYVCPNTSAAAEMGDIPVDFSTPFHQPQGAWSDDEMKLVMCRTQHTAPQRWNFYLYNLTADRAEQIDLWRDERPTALRMLDDFQAWQHSILKSQSNLGCTNP